MGLSPISAVTSGLNRINLKRNLNLLDDDQTLNPIKKQLIFVELDDNASPSHPPQPATTYAQHINVRKLKKSIRGNKSKRTSKTIKLLPTAKTSRPGYQNEESKREETNLLQRIEELMDQEENY
ncbi:hypothetical protein K1719_042028 [Acacia pycnantha]|nr:hypothetical protein K1719_042028 [Acacia pycnantha]